MNEFLLDSNIIIRFLTNDDHIQSPSAYKLFKKAVDGDIVLVLTPLIVAECTWVLSMKRYGYSKSEIAERFAHMISAHGIKAIDKELTLKSLTDYSIHNVDFMDAFLSAYAKLSDIKKIVTWNQKDFSRLDSEFYTPEHLLDS